MHDENSRGLPPGLRDPHDDHVTGVGRPETVLWTEPPGRTTEGSRPLIWMQIEIQPGWTTTVRCVSFTMRKSRKVTLDVGRNTTIATNIGTKTASPINNSLRNLLTS